MGENCHANDQLEKKDPVRNVLDFNQLVSPALCGQYASSSKTWFMCKGEECQLVVLALKDVDLVGSIEPIYPCPCTPQMSALCLDSDSNISAILDLRVPTFNVATVKMHECHSKQKACWLQQKGRVYLKVGIHQGSCLSLLLLIMPLEA